MPYVTYSINNGLDGTVYFGATGDWRGRAAAHFCWGSGFWRTDGENPLYEAMLKDGAEHFFFTVVDTFKTEAESFAAERRLVAGARAAGRPLYNRAEGGRFGNSGADQHGVKNPMHGRTHSAKTLAKMSAAQSGAKNHTFGKPRSPETRERIRQALLRRNR